MSGEKLQLGILVEKRLSARAGVKEISDVEGPGIVDKHVAENCFKCFKEGNTNFEDKPRSERWPVVENETLLEMVEQ